MTMDPALMTLVLQSRRRAVAPAFLGLLVPILAGAWSVNDQLLSTYSGPLLRTRRSSNNAESDIPSASGVCDRAALASWCGAGNGFVTKLYDQTANVRDLPQTAVGSQPQVYAAGVPVTQGGNMAMLFDGSNDHLIRADACGISGNPNVTLVALYQTSSAVIQNVISLGPLTSSTLFLLIDASLPSAAIPGTSIKYGAAQTGYHYDILRRAAGSGLISTVMRTNGSPAPYVSGGTATVNITNTQTTVGVGNAATSLQLNGKLSTLLILNALPSAPQLAALEAWLETRRLA